MTAETYISLSALNNYIDQKVREYDNCAQECIQEMGDQEQSDKCSAKSEALNDLKIDINDPRHIEDVSENMQQTSNVITAKNIINEL